MKQLFQILPITTALLLGGCQSIQPIAGSTTQQAGVATIEQAIEQNNKLNSNQLPSAAPINLMPPLNLEQLGLVNEEHFDITAEQLPARDFFMGLVEGTPYNMIVHDDVQGTISVQLKNVSVHQVMEAVRSVYGYEFKRSGNLYQVLPATLQTEIFHINYLDIKREGKSETQISAGSVSTAGENSSSDEVIGTHVTTVTQTDFWGSLQSTLATIADGEGRKVIVTPQTGVVVVKALPTELDTIRSYLQQAELILHRQVVIEAKILEVTLNNGFQSGISWSALGKPGEGKTALFSQSGGNVINNDGSGGIFRADLSLSDFSAVIELLGTQGDVQVLSSPRVSTVNNQKAVIKVGTDEFFVTEVETTTTTGTSTTTSPSIELTPFFSGIALDVTPQVSSEGDIVLHIHPTVSEVVDQQKVISVGADDFSIPLALSSIRESDSIVRADSGQVIVIGGLMKSTNSDQESKTPLLGDIPGVGNLFKQQQQGGSKTELVILLRPVLSDNDSLQQELERSLRAFRGFHAQGSTQ